jgi:hypothetical protein
LLEDALTRVADIRSTTCCRNIGCLLRRRNYRDNLHDLHHGRLTGGLDIPNIRITLFRYIRQLVPEGINAAEGSIVSVFFHPILYGSLPGSLLTLVKNLDERVRRNTLLHSKWASFRRVEQVCNVVVCVRDLFAIFLP